MLITKRNTRQFKEFDHKDSYTTVSGWNDTVEIEFNSGQGHKLVIEMSLERARALMTELSRTIIRVDSMKESGKVEAS